MNRDVSFDCIDAGSENCPCFLAETGDCLTCTRLQGKDYCDCNWKGVCIYNEYMQGNRRVNNPRHDFTAAIVQKKYYGDDLIVFILQVDRGFALKAGKPGSYLFVRGSEKDRFYDVPISVMKVDMKNGLIHLAVKVISAKTKSLAEEDEKLILRGPYRNGIQGVRKLTEKKNLHNKILVIAKGTGIAPGFLCADYFDRLTQVDFLVDPEKIGKEFVGDYLTEGPGILKYIDLSEADAEKKIKKILLEEDYQSILVLASDFFVKTIGKLVGNVRPDAVLAVSNNCHFCCGEGLCGACTCVDENGNTIRMCKCQIDMD